MSKENDPGTDLKRTLNSIEEADSNAVTYPILKEYNWAAKEIAVYKNYLGKDKPPIPLIAFGYNTRDNFVFLTKQKLGEKNPEEVHEEALRNIAAHQVTWDKFNDFVLTASGNDFASEKILCRDFLIEAERILNADEIIVAIPRRTVIYAANSAAPADSMKEFIYVVGHTLQDDSFGNAFITNLAFKFSKGELKGAFLIEARNSVA